MLTLEDVRTAVPMGQRNSITQHMVDELNNLSKDPHAAEHLRDNFLTYSQVLSEGKFKLGSYVRAVMYVTNKALGKTNLDAYKATFPDRYQSMVAEGKSSKDIAAFVSAYNNGKLVNLVYERSMVPTWILNADVYQQAINVQQSIMNDMGVSAHTRSKAADSIIGHLKKPEVAEGVGISVNIALDDGMKTLEDNLAQYASAQLKGIKDKSQTVEEVAAAPLIEGKAVEVNE